MERASSRRDAFEKDQDEFLEWIDWNLFNEEAVDECDEDASAQIEGVARPVSATPHDQGRTEGINRTGGRKAGEVDSSLQHLSPTCWTPLVCNMDRVSKPSEETEVLNELTESQVLKASTIISSKPHLEIPTDWPASDFLPSTDAKSFQLTPYLQTLGTYTAMPSRFMDSQSTFGFVNSCKEGYPEFRQSRPTSCASHRRNTVDCPALESFRFMESETSSCFMPQHQILVGCSSLQSSSEFAHDGNTTDFSEIMRTATVDSLPRALNFDDCTSFQSSRLMDVGTRYDRESQSEIQDDLGAQNQFGLQNVEASDPQHNLGPQSQTDVYNNSVVLFPGLEMTSKCDLHNLESALKIKVSPISPHRLELVEHESHDFSQVLDEPIPSHFQTAQPGTMNELEILVNGYRMKEPPLQVSHRREQIPCEASILPQEVQELSCDMKRLMQLLATVADLDDYSVSASRCGDEHHQPPEDFSTASSPGDSVKELTEGEHLDHSQHLEASLISIPTSDNGKAFNEICETQPDYTCPQQYTVRGRAIKGKRLVHSPKSLEILRAWWENHGDNPYPSEREVYEMIRMTELTHQQIYDWFKNERSRKGKSDPEKRKQKRLPHRATQVFGAWAQEHLSRPNPTKQQREQLAADAGVPLTQVTHWFTNFRKRSKAEIKKANEQQEQ